MIDPEQAMKWLLRTAQRYNLPLQEAPHANTFYKGEEVSEGKQRTESPMGCFLEGHGVTSGTRGGT